jgi:AcrR family transcriptional regulator
VSQEMRGDAPPDRDNRKAATQARILEAALALFVERGFERTTVAGVAARAGVSRAAIFWHFGDKATLFQETFRRLLVPFVRELERHLDDVEPRKRLFELFAVYERFVSEHRDTIETMVRWALESPTLRGSLQPTLLSLHAAFARDVRETLEAVLDDRTEAAEFAAGLLSSMHGNLLLSLLDPDPRAQELRAAGLRAMAKRALGGDAS